MLVSDSVLEFSSFYIMANILQFARNSIAAAISGMAPVSEENEFPSLPSFIPPSEWQGRLLTNFEDWKLLVQEISLGIWFQDEQVKTEDIVMVPNARHVPKSVIKTWSGGIPLPVGFEGLIVNSKYTYPYEPIRIAMLGGGEWLRVLHGVIPRSESQTSLLSCSSCESFIIVDNDSLMSHSSVLELKPTTEDRVASESPFEVHPPQLSVFTVLTRRRSF